MNSFKTNIFKTSYAEVIPIIACDQTANAGGVGVTEYTLLLDKPLGGVVVIDFNANGVPDKLEIIHNSVKKSTSGMTGTNAGPFDDVYGNPTVPTSAQAESTKQFIGTFSGSIPNRRLDFQFETGVTDLTFNKQQVIWWVYTKEDYNISPAVVIRITGAVGTAWDMLRKCTDQVPKEITNPTPPVGGECIIYTASTRSATAESYVYTDCTNIRRSKTLGGSGGVEKVTFTAYNIISSSPQITITSK